MTRTYLDQMKMPSQRDRHWQIFHQEALAIRSRCVVFLWAGRMVDLRVAYSSSAYVRGRVEGHAAECGERASECQHPLQKRP